MTAAPKRALWFVVGASSAVVAGAAVKRSLDAGWRAVTSKDPPDEPESLTIGWKDALLWTTVSAVAVDSALLGRYYERYADHAVNAGRHVVFLVTGESQS